MNQVDFKKSPEAARQTINAWVEEKTQNKIKELIAPKVLSDLTRLVLTNAIYFKGKWALKFDPKETREAAFWLTAKKMVMVPMMRQTGKFKTISDENMRAIELPYMGKDLSMIVLLPPKAKDIATFEQTLTSENLDTWISKLQSGLEQDRYILLPKFKIEAGSQLREILSQMGMPLAFSDAADFSRMTAEARLTIGAVIHKAFVEVNEEGTEAAAATAVGTFLSMGPPAFIVDCPFLFLIRDNASGCIVFMGRVMNPRA